MEVINNKIYIGENVIDISLCIQLKSLAPAMSFSTIIDAFSEGSPIGKDDYDDACELLSNMWNNANHNDVEVLPDENGLLRDTDALEAS